MKKNEMNIIKLLVSASDYMSSYEISTACAISQRSVRIEMKNVKEILSSLDYTLISEPSKGYKILESSPENLTPLFDYLKKEEQQRQSIFPTFPIERGSYILKRLVEQNDYIKIDDLADELLTSRSTITQNIRYIKNRILDNNLKFIQKPNCGIKIEGDEINLRKVLCDLLFLNLNHSDMLYDFLDTFILNPNSTEYHIIEILNKYNITISDIGLCDLLLSIIVAINRIGIKKNVTLNQDISIIKGRIELEAAKEICHDLSKKNGVIFSNDEILLIAIQIICKRSTHKLSIQNKISSHISKEILDEIKKRTLLTFTDKSFINTFELYVENSIIRLYFDEKIRTPIFESSSIIYPMGYELAKISSEIIEKHIHKKMSSSELATYSIIFDTAISNMQSLKKKVLLIYSYSGASASFLEQKILKEFNGEIIIYNSIPYYKLYNEDFDKYDFIITTIPIHQNYDISCITISQTFSSIDIKKIDNYLKYYCKDLNLELIFHPQLFNNHIKVRSFNNLIDQFYLQISKMYPFLKKITFSSLLNTSNCEYNFYNNEICFFKIHKPIHTNPILSVIILEKPLVYKKQNISVFIFLSSTDNSNYIYNTIHHLLTHISKNNDELNKIKSNPSYTEFLNTLNKIYKQSY